MKFRHILLIIALSILTAYAATRYVDSGQDKNLQVVKHETAYERIVRSGEIRCGYSSLEPIFFVDAKTGEKKGIFHDLMEEVGKRLNLRITWQEEVGWGSLVQSIASGRVDMDCAGYWLSPPRIKNLSSTVAQLYTSLYVLVRDNETRLFKTMEDLNSEQLTVVHVDGGAENQALLKHFPKTRQWTMSELSNGGDVVEALLTNKADFIILDSAATQSYMLANPGKVKNLFPDQPLILFPNVMLLPPEEPQLKEMIDDTLRGIEYDGTLDEIVKAYHMEHAFLRNPKPM